MHPWWLVVCLVGCGRLNFDPIGGGDDAPTADAAVPTSGTIAITAGDAFGCVILANREVACWGDGRVGQLGHGQYELRAEVTKLPSLSDVVDIDAGFAHACAVDGAGRVWCWGQNQQGEIGQPMGLLTSDYPLEVTLPQPATAIGVGDHHACAILADRSLWCWGENADGQVGVPASAPVRTPVKAFDDVIDVSLGGAFGCARRSDDSVWCWGVGNDGRLGDGTQTSRSTPMPASGLVARAISCGDQHCCAIVDGGRYRCWGQNNAGELGDGTLNNSATPNPPSSLTGIARIAAGDDHNCAVLSDGRAMCWGWDLYGALGRGEAFTTALLPVEVQNSGTVYAAAAGGTFSCIVHTDGTLACFGSGSRGELANGLRAEWTPQAVSLPNDAQAIVAGRLHACAVLVNADVYCWGANYSGQLGTGGAAEGTTMPQKVANVLGTGPIAAGDSHTCAVDNTATLRCWGANDRGQLGDGTTTKRLTPVTSMLSGPVAVAAGAAFTCGINISGVSCWGNDTNGELGDLGALGMQATPRLLGQLGSSITAGNIHACALNAGTVSCWGHNANGRLGTGTTAAMSMPTAVNGTYTLVESGYTRTCAMATNGTKSCWGRSDGAIGDGAFADRPTPTTIALGANVRAYGIGEYHSCAATDNGVWCWGQNEQGELGDGLGFMVRTARQTSNAFDPVEIVSGFRFSCARAGTGAVYCWGSNDAGQIGIGTTTRRTLPIDLALPD